MAKKRKLMRDKVISVVNGKALVGVYWEGTDLGSPSTRKKKEADVGSPTARKKREADGSEILFECSPEKADRIIEIFNGDEGGCSDSVFADYEEKTGGG